MIFATLAFCAGCIGYLVVWGEDIRLHETIASGLIVLAGSVVGSYVFGAAWDDMNAGREGRQPGSDK